jgi:hypothetical protein
MKRFFLLFAVLISVVLCARFAVGQSATPATPIAPLGGETGVKRSGQFYVQVYLQENFKGPVHRVPVPSELINENEHKKFGIPNDSIQSMKIPEGVVVTLYDGAGYGGKNQTYTGNVPTLGEMRSITSSLKAVLQTKP